MDNTKIYDEQINELRMLNLELEGVVQDVENSGFDGVCLETIKRTQKEIIRITDAMKVNYER